MTKQNIQRLAMVLGAVVLVWALAGAQGARKTYEIQPQIPESVFRGDSARALDAYERLVDRALDLNGRQLEAMDLRIMELSRQLDRVESKLDRVLNRGLLIEQALGIPPLEVKEAAKDRVEDPNGPDVQPPQ
jgi:hypothetical protein